MTTIDHRFWEIRILDSLFDQLILIAKGRLVYSGPAEEAIDHFAAMGYPIPLGFNVADYLIDLTMHALDDPTEEEAISILTGNADPGGDVPSDIITETPTRVTAQNVFDQFAAPPSDSESPIRASLSRHIPVSNADEFPNWGSTSPDRATGVQIPTSFEGEAEVWSSHDVTDNLSASPNRVSESGLRASSATDSAFNENVSLQRLVTEYSKSLILSKIRYEVMESAASASADDVSSPTPTDGQPTQGLRRSRSMSSFVSLNTTSMIRAADGKKRATGFQQFMILNSRTFKNLCRNPALLATHYMTSLCVAAICSGLFWKVKDDIGGFQNRMGLFFFVCALFGFSAISGMQVFSAERPIFVRERANGYYQPITYYMSKILFEFLPLRSIPPLIFGLICYHMIGLRSEEVSFFL
ncbi:ABC-2 type transporter-domain-containing protein [Chytriomyces cf. hyalinus JEL632]|nr:ABC-2 type transporter-domain-containing protein [Chytriomyces cf. hyalinus JEL632]